MENTYAVIENGAVVNLVIWDGQTQSRPEDFPEDEAWNPFPAGLDLALVPDGAQVAIGAHYQNGAFVPPEAPPIEPTPAPATVTMRQARLALHAAGMLDDVEDAVNATGDPAARIEWDYAATVERASPFTQQLAAALQLDDAALDALFTQAAAL